MRMVYRAALVLAASWACTAQAQAPAKAPPPPAASGAVIGPALYVTDLPRSLRFYRDVLEMKVKMQFGAKGKEDAVLGFGSDPRQLGLMLLSDKTAAVPRRIEHGHGFDRFALSVPDLAAVQTRLRAAGFQAGEIQTVHGTVKMMMATDPDGYKIELIQGG